MSSWARVGVAAAVLVGHGMKVGADVEVGVSVGTGVSVGAVGVGASNRYLGMPTDRPA